MDISAAYCFTQGISAVPAYVRFIALVHGWLRRVSHRSRVKKRKEAMRHHHDFDLGSSTALIGDDLLHQRPDDRARAPRGLLTGILIGAGLWGALILCFMV
jgi:hypothetical protein